MAFLKISSDNPKLSFILRKNPVNNLIVRQLHEGQLFTFYSNNDQTINCYFKDADNSVSYKEHKNEDFEYLNVSRYNSAMFVLNTFSELFSDALKKDSPDDTPSTHEVMVNMLYMKQYKTFDTFKRHFKNFEILEEELAYKNYRITFKHTGKLKDLLNFVSLFVVFTAATNGKNYLTFNDSLIAKYLECLNVIDAPYFIRYVFKSFFIHSKAALEKFRPILENSSQDMHFDFGDTQRMRRYALQKRVGKNHHIIDIGCGEGNYLTDLAPELEDRAYIAIDKDEQLAKNVSKKAKKLQLKNVEVLNSFDEFNSHIQLKKFKDKKFICLMVEVIEHMEKEEALNLVEKVLASGCERLIITTPNRDFNVHYGIDHFRHLDHKFEMNTKEFMEWFKHIKIPHIKFEFFGIGDKVNGAYPTIGVELC